MHELIPKYYYFINKLDIEEIKDLNNKIALIYRNYQDKPDITKIKIFFDFCKKKKIKFLISNHFDIAFKLSLDGFYIPSFNKSFFHKKRYSKNFIIAGSAHNVKEIKIKEKQNVNLIFLSPIFKSNKNRQCLDVIKYNFLTLNYNKNFIALGGINNKNIKRVRLTKSYGIAGITEIKKIKKNGPKN